VVSKGESYANPMSRVCITFENSPSPLSGQISLCKHVNMEKVLLIYLFHKIINFSKIVVAQLF